MKVINQTKSIILAGNVIMANSFLTRLKGLLVTPYLPAGWCLVLKPCRSVHTMFMRFNIDIIFVDRHNTIVSAINNMSPFRFSSYIHNSYLTIEFPAGTLKSTCTTPGDIIKISKE